MLARRGREPSYGECVVKKLTFHTMIQTSLVGSAGVQGRPAPCLSGIASGSERPGPTSSSEWSTGDGGKARGREAQRRASLAPQSRGGETTYTHTHTNSGGVRCWTPRGTPSWSAQSRWRASTNLIEILSPHSDVASAVCRETARSSSDGMLFVGRHLALDRLSSFPLFVMAQAKETSPAKETSHPVQVYRLRGLSASVFENQANSAGRVVPYHKVALQRIYRDGNGWRTTTSLGRDDLPIARLLLNRAWQFILDVEAMRGREVEDSDK